VIVALSIPVPIPAKKSMLPNRLQRTSASVRRDVSFLKSSAVGLRVAPFSFDAEAALVFIGGAGVAALLGPFAFEAFLLKKLADHEAASMAWERETGKRTNELELLVASMKLDASKVPHALATATAELDKMRGILDLRGAVGASLTLVGDSDTLRQYKNDPATTRSNIDLSAPPGIANVLFTRAACPGFYSYLQAVAETNSLSLDQLLSEGREAYDFLSKLFPPQSPTGTLSGSDDGSRDQHMNALHGNRPMAAAIGALLRITRRSPEFYEGGKAASFSGIVLPRLPPTASVDDLCGTKLRREDRTGTFYIQEEDQIISTRKSMRALSGELR
jgi:hypothetical protein